MKCAYLKCYQTHHLYNSTLYQDIEYYHHQRKFPYRFPNQPILLHPRSNHCFVFYFYSITFMDSRISLYGTIAWLLLRNMLFLRFVHMVVAIIYSFSLLSSSVPLFKHSLFVHFSRVFLIFLFICH